MDISNLSKRDLLQICINGDSRFTGYSTVLNKHGTEALREFVRERLEKQKPQKPEWYLQIMKHKQDWEDYRKGEKVM